MSLIWWRFPHFCYFIRKKYLKRQDNSIAFSINKTQNQHGALLKHAKLTRHEQQPFTVFVDRPSVNAERGQARCIESWSIWNEQELRLIADATKRCRQRWHECFKPKIRSKSSRWHASVNYGGLSGQQISWRCHVQSQQWAATADVCIHAVTRGHFQRISNNAIIESSVGRSQTTKHPAASGQCDFQRAAAVNVSTS